MRGQFVEVDGEVTLVLPTAALDRLGVQDGDDVEVVARDGCLVIEACAAPVRDA